MVLGTRCRPKDIPAVRAGAVRHKQRKPKQAERGADAGSSAGIRGNYRLGIAWSRGKVIAGIKTGAVEVGIYIRADSAAEAALCWGLRDAE